MGSIEMADQQGLKVLVVDREEEPRLQLKDLLTQEGHTVTLLSDPDLAADEVRRSRFQMVLLDVSPGAGGVEALAAIRCFDDDICVIATTGIASVEAAIVTMKHQAFHYLQKPLEADEVRAVVREAIRDRGLLVDLETHLNSEVGRRLRGRRHESALTLKQLANRTGLSVSLISQIELGKSAASMSTMHKLSAALGSRMSYFFETV